MVVEGENDETSVGKVDGFDNGGDDGRVDGGEVSSVFCSLPNTCTSARLRIRSTPVITISTSSAWSTSLRSNR